MSIAHITSAPTSPQILYTEPKSPPRFADELSRRRPCRRHPSVDPFAPHDTFFMVTTLPSGELEFKVFAPTAASVELLGTFTGWFARPLPLTSSGEGWWTARTAVAPGDHDFQYRIDGELWMTDYAAHGVRMNQQGEWISRLAVQKAA